MPHGIKRDHEDFIDVISGRLRKALKKYINNGKIFRGRGNSVPIPGIDQPHFVFGENDSGVGRGQGKEGDVVEKGNEKGKGKAGQGTSEGIDIKVDLEEVLKFMKDELKLPDLKPKTSNIFDEVKIKYNDISLTGPESLRHNPRTWKEAMKRLAASGKLDELHTVPGFKTPIRLITPINNDRRYRRYKEIKFPSNNAVIFFARDGSGSMDQQKCEIVSNMAWWIDVWIRRFYKKVERCYVWHDEEAKEVDEKKFYKHRYGGGTRCSSALKLIHKQLENRFPPDKWNVYVFYFTDGDNWGDDNNVFLETLKTKLTPQAVNFVGITQILGNGLKEFIDSNISDLPHVKTVNIDGKSEDDIDLSVKEGIIKLLGKEKV